MKNLAYPSALLFGILLFASCTKNDLVKPSQTDTIAQSKQPVSPCGSPSAVSYKLINNTRNEYFTVAFSGPAKYLFSLPANSSKTVTLQSGTYELKVYTDPDTILNEFSLGTQPGISAYNAAFSNLMIDPCHTISQLQLAVK